MAMVIEMPGIAPKTNPMSRPGIRSSQAVLAARQAARYELSLSPGFVSLAESLRKHESPTLLDHAQRLPSGVAS